nr:reverse transcriptase domain-containing protein [Tanacetum cinerariifolium]
MLAICFPDKAIAFKAPMPSSNVERVPQGTKPRAKTRHKKHLPSLKQPSMSSKKATKASTVEADPGNYAPSDFIPQQQDQTKSVSEGLETILTQPFTEKRASSVARQIKEETSNTIKLDDLAKMVSHVQPSFKDLDSPEDDPIIVVDDSDEDEDDEVHATQNSQKHKLELEKNKAKAEVALLKAQPSFLNVEHLKELLRDDDTSEIIPEFKASDLHLEIPEFVGKARPDEFIDWLSTIDRIFDLRDVPEILKVKLVAIKLRKSASLWWDHVKNQRVKDGKSKVKTWTKMKKLLPAKFLPVNHRQEAFIEYHNFSQRTSSSVEDFIAEFDRLRMRCDVDEEEEQVITWFLGALQPYIADVVHLQQYLTYEDDIDELMYADQGEALVTQLVLNVAVAETGDDTSWLQNNIFRTKCTTKGKLCTVIIDGGSCDNMVATSMVEKLGLDVQDHPEPYQLTWLKKGVSSRFPAGRYGKLQARADGPFWVLKRINDNTYKIELTRHYNMSATLNVADLSPYEGDSDDGLQSGVPLFQDGEDDAGASHASNLFVK